MDKKSNSEDQKPEHIMYWAGTKKRTSESSPVLLLPDPPVGVWKTPKLFFDAGPVLRAAGCSNLQLSVEAVSQILTKDSAAVKASSEAPDD